MAITVSSSQTAATDVILVDTATAKQQARPKAVMAMFYSFFDGQAAHQEVDMSQMVFTHIGKPSKSPCHFEVRGVPLPAQFLLHMAGACEQLVETANKALNEGDVSQALVEPSQNAYSLLEVWGVLYAMRLRGTPLPPVNTQTSSKDDRGGVFLDFHRGDRNFQVVDSFVSDFFRRVENQVNPKDPLNILSHMHSYRSFDIAAAEGFNQVTADFLKLTDYMSRYREVAPYPLCVEEWAASQAIYQFFIEETQRKTDAVLFRWLEVSSLRLLIKEYSGLRFSSLANVTIPFPAPLPQAPSSCSIM